MGDRGTSGVGATLAALLLLTAGLGAGAHARAGEVAIEPTEVGARVLIDGRLFTEVDWRSYRKPICYPIFGPDQTPMTRNYPMKEGVSGEATDHRHHMSLWFGHGDVNGTSFWHDQGRMVVEEPVRIEGDQMILPFQLLDADDQPVATGQATLRFAAELDARMIDWDLRIEASHGPLAFGDTKEGTMAIRTHPNLRLRNDPGRGVTTANGTAVNSQGEAGAGIWGKRAQWVDYSGQIDEKLVGIAIFDHPENLRHPTYWHARDYGLVAANPFGIRDFGGQGSGDHTVAANQSIRFRYRFVFHQGDVEQARIADRFGEYTGSGGGEE